MNKYKCDTKQLSSIIRNTAIEELLPRFAQVKESQKADGSLLTEADIAVQKKLHFELQNLDPEILFLSEEMTESEQRHILEKSNHAVWVLDPLDGTTNFAAGIPYYAISLALIRNGETVLGLVYDPERDECFAAEKDLSVTLNGEKLHLNNSKILLNDAVACIDLKRLPEAMAIKLVVEHPFRSQRSFGGVALDWCWLAAGRFDIYLHGKQNIWDYAAGLLIFHESGGLSCSDDGTPVFVNELNPRVGIGAANTDLFKQWTQYLGI